MKSFGHKLTLLVSGCIGVSFLSATEAPNIENEDHGSELIKNISDALTAPIEASQLAVWRKIADRIDSLKTPEEVTLEGQLKWRRAKTILWLRLIEKAQETYALTIRNTKAYLNVEAPPDAQVPAGTDPSAIGDPAQRAQYENDIRKNNENIEKINSAIDLHNCIGTWSFQFELFVKSTYTSSSDDKKEIAALIDKWVPSTSKADLQARLMLR